MRGNVRAAARAPCVQGGRMPLARSPGPWGVAARVLPGGGTEHGEDPHETVVREVAEETGDRVEVTGLPGADRPRRLTRRRFRPAVDRHGVRTRCAARVTGGDPGYEAGGSTGPAARQALAAVPGPTRVPLAGTGLRPRRERPATGRLARAEEEPPAVRTGPHPPPRREGPEPAQPPHPVAASPQPSRRPPWSPCPTAPEPPRPHPAVLGRRSTQNRGTP
ncbi:NUDIX domain-containing protein [Streptomyces sp. PRKS01-65]|nr:NUDIX domain-containing protein [Streptomyces harenosi]NEY33483.1 NUDIX domain-containing protein [Streptomyces harenosi]